MIYFTREQLSKKYANTMSYAALIKHTRVYQEAREEEATDAIFRLLKKRFGQDLSEQTHERIQSLSLPALRKLTEDLLDFTYEADLQLWLDAQ